MARRTSAVGTYQEDGPERGSRHSTAANSAAMNVANYRLARATGVPRLAPYATVTVPVT